MPVRAKQSFTAEGRHIGRGQVLSSRDPIIKGRSDFFDPLDDDSIETTRRAPGQKRATKKAATKKSAKKTATKKANSKKGGAKKKSAKKTSSS